MKKPKGTDVVVAVQRLLEAQMLRAQNTKQDEILDSLGDFAREYGIPVQTGPLNSLARLLRNKGAEVNRQVRSLSDALLLKDERELDDELELLREKLSKVEAAFHQVKTKNAFVLTVLRPFSPKFADRWFEERDDINPDSLRAAIERLESKEIGSALDLADWVDEVSMLFEHLVVYRGENAEDYYSRPAGTISAKSSRTYLQAWLAFTKQFKRELWSMVSGQGDIELKTKAKAVAVDYDKNGFDQTVSVARAPSSARSSRGPREANQESFSMMMAPPQERSDASFLQSPPRSSKSKPDSVRLAASKEDSVGWIQIFIESKIDPTAQATRKWESQTEFRLSLQKWLDTFPVIWGSAADQFLAKVTVKTSTGESDLTLPSLTVKEAADRLTKAVEMQQD